MPRRRRGKRGSRYYRVRSSLSLARALPPTAPHHIDGAAPGRSARPMQRRLLRASISPMNVRPFSVSRKQSRRLPSWLTTPSTHRPDGFSQLAACSVQHGTCVQQDSCNMQQCSMQHTTCRIDHVTCNMTCACTRHRATHDRAPGRMHDMRHGASTGRPADGPGTHRRLQARHQQGRAAAGDLGGRARRGLRDRGVHPPSQPVRCCEPRQSQRPAPLGFRL
jgi:hypothetical protein